MQTGKEEFVLIEQDVTKEVGLELRNFNEI